LTKGTQVFVEGQPEARSFQRNDGTPGSSLSLRVREVQLLGSKSDNAGGSSSFNTSNSSAAVPSAGSNVPAASEITEPIDDLPF
jgi:single-strand DNA-binding protein